jgi:hypothetical protein
MNELEKIVDILEERNDKEIAANPDIQKSISIVEDFIKKHSVMCYGGTAINNLLPKEDRFYDPVRDVPDYDFFSKTPQEHAMVLANRLYDAGITMVEVKPGVHFGTFKVFANFTGIADITELEHDIFDRLWDEKITRNGIHYVPPDFLRMSMYLELSRPRGDVSRWKKVYERLLLLNKHYPIVCKKEDAQVHNPIPNEVKRKLASLIRKYPVVLLGTTASEVHLRKEWTSPVMLLADKETINQILKGREKDVVIDEGNEILPTRYSLYEEDGSSYLRLYESSACHSYHSLPDGTMVASIPTILQFFFAYLYSSARSENIASIQCIAQRLVDIAHSKPKRRFAILTPIDCHGRQETLVDIRKTKAELYEKYAKNKSSIDYLRYFFTYTPDMTKTQRAKVRTQLRKTRKARYESSE